MTSQLEQALISLEKGDRTSAITILNSIVRAEPKNAEAWSFYGIALLKKNKGEGISALRKACDLSPTDPLWQLHLGTCLNQIKAFSDAEEPLKNAVRMSNYSPDTSFALVDTLTNLGRGQEALNVLEITFSHYRLPAVAYKHSQIAAAMHNYTSAIKSLKDAHQNTTMSEKNTLLLAKWYIYIKDFSAAKDALEIILSINSYHPEAIMMVSNIEKWKGNFDKAEDLLGRSLTKNPSHVGLIIEQLSICSGENKSLYERAVNVANNELIDNKNRIKLFFTLAQAADRHSNYESAWEYATSANALSQKGVKFNQEVLVYQLDNALRLYEKSFSLPINETIQPIYFLGSPRCGGSVLQTVLAAAPNIVSVGERGALLPWLLPLLQEIDGLPKFQQKQRELQLADIAGLQNFSSSARVFVDKTTHNTHVAGLLHRIHPNAQFIEIRRNKKDTALSIYMRNFSSTFNYSYNLTDIDKYLDFQLYAANKWRDIGVPLITHDHDSFVKEPKKYGERLFKKLDLTWYDTFIESKSRTASVETFSSQQVRNEIKPPIKPKWQHYASQLEEIN